MRTPALVLSLLVAAPAQILVKDINTVPGAQSLFSDPRNGREVLGEIYFSADDGIHGRELWRTDGTLAGTWLVADINPGPASSNPSRPAWIQGGNTFLFSADDGAHGAELWESDGTAAGTLLVKDINPGPTGSSPAHLTEVVSLTFARFYFSADDGTRGRELWGTNGTAAGTTIVTDLRPGSASSMTLSSEIWDDPNSQNAYGYFTADNGSIGEELWKVSATGATLVRDINPSGSSTPRLIMSTYPRLSLLFAATHLLSGREPWHVIDGVASLAADLAPGVGSSSPTTAVPAPGVSSPPTFLVDGAGASGRELYRVVIGGAATLLKDINPGAADSDPVLWAESPFTTTVLLAATSATEGRELWMSNGTNAGTVLLEDINPGRASSNPRDFFDIYPGASSRVVFAADNGSVGEELWITDRTARGTYLLEDCLPGAASSMPRLVADDDRTIATFGLFNLQDPTHGFEPWIVGNTAATTFLLKDIRGPVVSSTPREFTTLGTTAVTLFVAGETTFGTELWRTDATTAGTTLVKDIKPGSDGSGPQGLAFALGKVFFAADDGTSGMEPWVSDGTAAGTVRLADLAPGNASSTPHGFVQVGSTVYFGATDTVNGFEVWRTDGTTAGTTMIVDLEPGAQGANPNHLTAHLGHVYFAATTAAYGTELWRSDGTAANTVLVKDINPGVASAGVNGQMEVFACPLGIFLGANSGSGDVDLWRTDGSAANTVQLATFDGADGPREFALHFPRVYFAATTTALGRELWAINGNTVSLVRDIAPGTASGDPVGMRSVGSRVVFAATNAGSGRELWRSDGTSAGTVLVVDLNPGAANGLVIPASVNIGRRYTITPVNGQSFAYCTAFEMATGIELWRTDGTAAGTTRVGDVNLGAAGSRPGTPVRCGTSWVLAADGGAIGTEVHRFASPATWFQYGVGCRGGLGLVPQIAGNGAPELGNAGFAVMVSDARPSTAGAMFLAGSPLSLPLGNGCGLHVDLFGANVSLAFGTNARGDGSVALGVPFNLGLLGVSLHAQMVLADAGGAYAGIAALTGGLQMLIAR